MRLNQAIVWLLLLCVAVGSSSSKIHADEQLDRILAIQQQRVDTIAKARAASVAIFSSDGRGGGSGVLVSPDGYAVTNFHVVRPCGPFMKCGLDDGNVYDAVIVGIDATGDVALIKLHGRDDFPTAPLADSNKVRLGEACFAIGNPFLLATNMTPTVTWGVVSGVHRYQEPADTLLETPPVSSLSAPATATATDAGSGSGAGAGSESGAGLATAPTTATVATVATSATTTATTKHV